MIPPSSSGQIYKPIFRKIENKLQSQMNPFPITLSGIDIHQQALTCSNWKPLVDEIIHQIERQRAEATISPTATATPTGTSRVINQPLIGIGHSVGGALLTIVASQRPDLFDKLILIDSPYFHPKKRFVWGLGLKFLPLSKVRQLNPMVKKALSKLYHWDSLQSAREYLSQRNVFRDMNSEIFESFLVNGLMKQRQRQQHQEGKGHDSLSSSVSESNGDGQAHGGVELVFSREAEANLMLTVQIDLPFLTNLNKESVGQYQISPHLSGYFLYSKQHDFLDKEDLTYAQSLFPKTFSFIEYDHSHFWPLIKPEEFSEKISELIRRVCLEDEERR
jgi:hypothetical protein